MAELMEQLQEDVITYLDGMNDKTIDDLCEIIINNFRKYKEEN